MASLVIHRQIEGKKRLLMINSYLGNICPFSLVTRNVKEVLNMSTTLNQSNNGAIQYGRHWLHLCIADALSSLISDQ